MYVVIMSQHIQESCELSSIEDNPIILHEDNITYITPKMKISIITNILVLGFYRYISGYFDTKYR